MDKLLQWIEDHNLDCIIQDPIVIIDEKKYLFIRPKDGKILDKSGAIILSDIEYEQADGVDYLLFQFGNRFYYCDTIQNPHLKEFKYLGKPKLTLEQKDYPFLGVHGGYDLCNGSRAYEDWCKKAKWLGITTLGICEDNTLAGVIPFQNACEKYGIRGIIGESVIVKNEKETYRIKLYCLNREEGWKNLLEINSKLNVFEPGYIKEEDLLKHTKGLVCVISPEVQLADEHIFTFINNFDRVFYQLDFTEWDSQDKDLESLQNLKCYLDQQWNEILHPLLISDAYYLEKGDQKIRKTLNIVGKVNFKNQSKNQYFKTIDDYFLEALELFPDSDRCQTLLEGAICNTIALFKDVDVKAVTGKFFLPKYEMTEEEKDKFASNEDLLLSFVEKGMREKVIEKGLDVELYKARVEREFAVIKKGGFIDYFLILADIFRFANEKDIWYGIGRGSAAGCLVSYLCDIVSIDPIKYNLLFERFLNEGRLGKSLPDVDTDWQGERRDEIKKYIEQKYGTDYVTSIGTYGTFKLKNAIKDIARSKGADYTKTNFAVAGIDTEASFSELFQIALLKQPVYEFVQDNFEVIEDLPLCLNQPKNASIHAAGVVIVPKENGLIYQQLPVKSQSGMLVSEWEGEFIDQAGFLKIDVLGIKQLDKFAAISKLILETEGKNIRFKDIDLDDQQVLALFKLGYNEDVFQFGAPGLKAYCKELGPDNIEDLIATVALYRPGPIESGAHKKYAKIKNGLEELEYDEGTEEITKITYGQVIYQEQIMQVFRDIGGFSLVEADDIRKVIAKTGMEMSKKMEILGKYKDRYIENAVAKGYSRQGVNELWDKIEKFATYSFNRSHAACYAITGYYSQWYKVHYPLQFWTVSMQYAGDDEKATRISEIQKISNIKIAQVDINKSTLTFRPDLSSNTIYWALPSVKWVGDKVVTAILEEREKGQFYSLEEFCQRMKGQAGINKRAIAHLIISGAFDEIENIKNITKRFDLLERFVIFSDDEMKADYALMKGWRDHQWVLKQRELTGFGFINFKKALQNTEFGSKIYRYKDNSEILSIIEPNESCLAAGVLTNLIERNSKRGVFAQLELEDNTDKLYVTVWNDKYEPLRKQLKEGIGKIVAITGALSHDGKYKGVNVMNSTKDTQITLI